ncbi:MAG: hypothetical protein HUJ71_06135 [Pseudobutyrivibrio sp.]|nr:hypothetical protein [Pseudobutyrivibrio sp.]
MAVPLFITAMVFMIFFMRVLEVQSGIQRSIDMSSRVVASTASKADEESKLLTEAIASSLVLIEKNNVPVSYIGGGMAGISFLKSSVKGNYIELRADYNITFPVGLLGRYSYQMTQIARNRKWIGYDPDENAKDGVYVYITKTGVAYHTTVKCPYLSPSVKAVNANDINNMRNQSDGKYYPCKNCDAKRNHGATVYITDYGEVYHSTLTCSSLKRTINKVLLEKVKDTHRPCGKCGG